MTIEAELADGRILEFPDGTDPAVVQATVKRVVGAGQAAPPLGAPSGPASAPVAPSDQPSFIDQFRAANLAGGSIQQRVGQGRETLSQENIGNVLGLAGPAAGATLAAQALRAAPLAIRSGAVGSTLAAGDIAQQSGEIISGQREELDPTQTRLAGALGAGGQAGGELIPAIPGVLANLTRRIFRGGEAGRQSVRQAIDDLDPFGVAPSAAVATERPALDVAETILSRTPGGRAPMQRAVDKTTKAVQDKLEQMATSLGRGQTPDPVLAGESVQAGAKQFAQRFSTQADRAFSRIGKFVSPDARIPVGSTRAKLDELTQLTPGAEQTSELFVQPFIGNIRQRFIADAADGNLPFASLQRLRSLVGRRLNDPSLVSDIPRGELKQLYGALSDDIGAAANQAGPRASEAFERANRFYRLGRQRIDKTLDPLAKKNEPEKIFRILERGAQEGPTQIRKVMKSLNPAQRDAVTGALIRRMGRATSSQQMPDSDVFSFETFLTNWDKMRRAGSLKAAFQHDLGLFQNMEKLARSAGRVRESSQAFRNPPGTAGAVIGQGLTLGALASAMTGATAFAQGLAGVAGAANLSARLLTNPKFVRWLARSSDLKPSEMSGHIGRLSGIAGNDPEMQAAVLAFMGNTQ